MNRLTVPHQVTKSVAAEPRFRFRDAAEFLSADYSPEWLVPHVLVKGQPGVIAGPSKSLKTSIAMDLAVSLAAGRPFLGRFPIPNPVSVAVASGESGSGTLQLTTRRVMSSRGVRVDDLGGRFGIEFILPTLSDGGQIGEFVDALERRGAEVVVIDPLYLCLGNADARSMFEVGAVLSAMANALAAINCTPILLHHANRQIEAREPMELHNLSHAGVEQFARQWILLNRADRYSADGTHSLWMSIGGSAFGTGGIWAVDVDEGKAGADFGGRTWNVTVTEQAVVKADSAAKREAKRAASEVEVDTTVLAQIAAETGRHGGATKTALATATGKSAKTIEKSIARLTNGGAIAEVQFMKRGGNGANTPATGWRTVNAPNATNGPNQGRSVGAFGRWGNDDPHDAPPVRGGHGGLSLPTRERALDGGGGLDAREEADAFDRYLEDESPPDRPAELDELRGGLWR